MRRLPGPAVCRLSEGDPCSRGSLRIVSGLAVNTHSIFCDGPSRPEAANGCPVLRRAGTTSREAYVRTAKPDITQCALSRARPGHLCLPLTNDLHGRRQYIPFRPTGPRVLQRQILSPEQRTTLSLYAPDQRKTRCLKNGAPRWVIPKGADGAGQSERPASPHFRPQVPWNRRVRRRAFAPGDLPMNRGLAGAAEFDYRPFTVPPHRPVLPKTGPASSRVYA